MASDFERIERLLQEQNRLLRAILTVSTEHLLRGHPEIAASRFQSIDHALARGGTLTNTEIADILGKSPQAVGQMLRKEPKG